MVEDVSFACAAAPPGFKSIPKAIVSSHSRTQSKNSDVAAERKGNGIFDSRTHIALSHAVRCGGREKLRGQWGISQSPFGSKKCNPDATKGVEFRRVKMRGL